MMKPPPESGGQHRQVQRQRLTWLPRQTVELVPLIRPYVDVIKDGELGQTVHEEASVSGNESQWVPLEHKDTELLQTGQLVDQTQQIHEVVKAQVKGDEIWPKERTQRRRLGKCIPLRIESYCPGSKKEAKIMFPQHKLGQTGESNGTISRGQLQLPDPYGPLPVCPTTQKHVPLASINHPTASFGDAA